MKEHEYKKSPHFAAGLMRPFISGARIQLERYIEAQRIVDDYKIIGTWFDRCLFESSSLLEHLSTISNCLHYAGINLPIHEKIADLRNHVRHDARGEIDYRSDRRAKN